MMSKIKNSIIFIAISSVLVLSYFFLFKKDSQPAGLIVSAPGTVENNVSGLATDSSVDRDFLPLLLSVKDIKLDDSIFKNTAFQSLVDSSIVLTPDNTEGRNNPFAPLGSDPVIKSTPTSTTIPAATNN